MALAERRATAEWHGTLREGSGTVQVGTGALPEFPVTFPARTEEPGGKTSPEELMAAAEASCFSMALSNGLTQAGSPPERLSVTATCRLDRVDGKLKITTMAISVSGQVPGIDEQTFREAAETAAQNCPVSGALKGNVEITLEATLE